MLRKLYDKSKILFAVLWIAAYCVLMSVGDSLSAELGVEKSVTLAIGISLSVLLLLFLKKNLLLVRHGLCLPRARAKEMLYYLPLILMLFANIWQGIDVKYSIIETILYILSMFCVGFLEEVIFRGLLFEAMRGDSPKAAVIVSSLTFGIGHIINLINGSGAELLPNLLQVIYATAAGFMFVMIYLRSESLVVCIAFHGLFNALSVFSPESSDAGGEIATAIFLTVVSALYALFLAASVRKRRKNEGEGK